MLVTMELRLRATLAVFRILLPLVVVVVVVPNFLVRVVVVHAQRRRGRLLLGLRCLRADGQGGCCKVCMVVYIYGV